VQRSDVHDGDAGQSIKVRRITASRQSNDNFAESKQDQVRMIKIECLSGACHDAQRPKGAFTNPSLNIIKGEHAAFSQSEGMLTLILTRRAMVPQQRD
jgi:hypothetical protein